MRKIEVLVRADTTRLVTVADFNTLAGVSGVDAVVGQIIDDLTSQVETYMGRPLALQRYRETILGDGSLRLALAAMPAEEDSIAVTIDGTSYTDWYVERGGILYRPDGWNIDDEPNVVVTYYGGWLMPGAVSDWSGSAAQAAGAWVRPSVPSLSPLRFEAQGAGTTAATEPTWPTTAGETVTDNDITWSARAVEEMPVVVRGLAYLAIRDAFLSRGDRSDLQGERAGPFGETYRAKDGQPGVLTPQIKAALETLRVAV